MRLVNKVLAVNSSIAPDQKRLVWWRLGLLTVSVVYLYVFMEWLFFVTKPSFMDVMDIGAKVEVLFFTGLFLSLLSLLVILALFGLSYLPGLASRWVLFLYMGGVAPAAILSATSLLMVDNFTYTLFRFGVSTSQGVFRIFYGVLFLLVFILWYRWVLRHLRPDPEPPKIDRSLTIQSILVLGVMGVSLALAFPKIDLLSNSIRGGIVGGTTKRPHILLIGSDGVNASNMSLYGYERDTTPNLRALASSSLIAENAYTNSANSPGSIISILTGKFPTNNRVIYPPDILRNSDSYQHLPGILRGLGYRNIEISVGHYIDAYTLNLRDGFDEVNERSIDQAGFQAFTNLTGLQDIGYFLSVLTERISDRILHIVLIQEMSNPYQEVTSSQFQTSDQTRVRKLLRYFAQTDQPLFIHVHLMGTHGAKFELAKQVFSSGQSQDSNWMTDFYDDAILEFDDYVGSIWSELLKKGMLEDTIVIIYSDHGQKYVTDQRIPLIIRFPDGEFAGRIRNNVQNLDIAPTILDYMGLPIPEWMEGQSLLAGEPDPYRPIFSTGATHVRETGGYFLIDVERLEPPFYQFGFMGAIVCQNWYRITLRDYTWVQGEITGHTAPCEQDTLPDVETVQDEILERLEVDGFEVSSLRTFFSKLVSD